MNGCHRRSFSTWPCANHSGLKAEPVSSAGKAQGGGHAHLEHRRQLVRAGYLPKMLQEITGHASITTTLDLYGHLYPGDMDRTQTALTVPPTKPIRPKSDQMGRIRMRTVRGQARDLGIYWRAQRCRSEGLEPPAF